MHERTDGLPAYVRIAHEIAEAIAAERFPVGSLLPTEEELVRRFGVSRHTIRSAIRHLRDQGLLSARRGIGTRVDARHGSSRFSYSLHSIAEVQQYAESTRLQVLTSGMLSADGVLAAAIGCRAGRAWFHVAALRRHDREAPPICWSDIYVDPAYAEVGPAIGVERMAVHALLERHFGETIQEVQQDIHASLVPAAHATALQAEPESPALRIVRRYLATGGRLVEASVSIHPADRFHYSMRLKRDVG